MPDDERNLLKECRDRLLEMTRSMPDERFAIRGIWNLDLRFQPTPTERLFRYQVIVIQSAAEGACYAASSDPVLVPDEIIGQDARTVTAGPIEIEIAALDSAFAAVPLVHTRSCTLSGLYFEKAGQRAAVVADTIDDLAAVRTARQTRVLNIGAIGNILAELRKRNYEVTATDLDESIIGSDIAGVRIADGSENNRLIAEADIVLISGMTLATHSLVNIVETSRSAGAKCIVIAETGAHLAPHYRDLLGLDAVVAEPFPFYTFSGQNRMLVYMG